MKTTIKGNYRSGSQRGIGLRVPLKRHQISAWVFQLSQAVETTSAAFRAGSILAAVIGADGRLDPAKGWIATKMDRSYRTVTRALDKLATLGFLTWHRRLAVTDGIEHQTSNAYQLQFPDPLPACEASPEPLSTAPLSSLSDNNEDSLSSEGIVLSDTQADETPAKLSPKHNDLSRFLPIRVIRQTQLTLVDQRKAMEARIAAAWRGRRGAS